jgi:hypothetical protein
MHCRLIPFSKLLIHYYGRTLRRDIECCLSKVVHDPTTARRILSLVLQVRKIILKNYPVLWELV